jgi:hypothetical protein
VPVVSGTVATLLVAALAGVALVSWIVRERRDPGPRLVGREPPIDIEELERAEREVHLLDPPPDELLRDEWPTGVPRPPGRL